MIRFPARKIMCLVLSLIIVFGFATAVCAYSSAYTKHARFHVVTAEQAQAKYDNGDKFILYRFRDSCQNSQYIGNNVIAKWMDAGQDIYGMEVDETTLPVFLVGQLPNPSTLPSVIFVDNKKLTVYTATNMSVYVMEEKLKVQYYEFTGSQSPGETFDGETLNYSVKCCQSEARKGLDKRNNLRKSGNAWYWNSDNKTKVTPTDLSPLSYDYKLEEVAMQRAAELVAVYSHTRPNGKKCFTAYNEEFNPAGENIAYGYDSLESVQKAWEEESEKYENQGHRRNMLSKSSCVGLGCVEFNGKKFWVQEFAYNTLDTTYRAPSDGAKTFTVDVLNSNISGKEIVCDKKSISMSKGETASLPAASYCVIMKNSPRSKIPLSDEVSWSSSNTSVLTVSGTSVTAVAEGSANLVASAAGKTLSIPVTVGKSGGDGSSYVTFGAESVNVGVGKTLALPLTYSGGTVAFVTSDPSIATVDSNGTVTGVSEGTATITGVIGEKGVSDTITVNVVSDSSGEETTVVSSDTITQIIKLITVFINLLITFFNTLMGAASAA